MPRRSDVMPLREFPADMRARIDAEIAASRPPARYREFHDENGRVLASIESRGWWEWHWQRGIDPNRRRDRIPGWLREQVIARDGHVCQLCYSEVDPADIHLDHITPFSLGGLDVLGNLQVTHSRCNILKGARI